MESDETSTLLSLHHHSRMDSSNHESESAKVERIVSQFLSKSLHAIIQSRCVFGTSSHTHNNINSTQNAELSKKDRWFNLALRDCCITGFLYSKLMVVDIVLLQQSLSAEAVSCRNDCFRGGKEGKVIERWIVLYEGRKGRDDDDGLKSSCRSPGAFYKKCVVMLRSLYLMLRMLPAYKVYRELAESDRECGVSLVHCVSSFVKPFAGEIEAEMRRYVFEPVESLSGRLCLSVLHLPALQELRLRPPKNQIISHLIPDYFGADLVRFVSGAVVGNKGKVIAGSKASGSDMKPSLVFLSEQSATHDQLLTSMSINSSTRETSVCGVKIGHAANCQCSPARLASLSTSLLARMSIRPLHYLSQAEVGKFLHPEESGDPFPAELSDNAALGALVNVFQTAAPLRLSSTIQSNVVMVSTTAEIPTSSPLVKTSTDAFQELQVHIDMKNTILERSYLLHNSDK